MGSDPVRDAANARRITIYLRAAEIDAVRELASLGDEKPTDFVVRAVRAELTRMGRQLLERDLEHAPDGLRSLVGAPTKIRGDLCRRQESGHDRCDWCGNARKKNQPLVRYGAKAGIASAIRWEPAVYCGLPCRNVAKVAEEGAEAYRTRGPHPDAYKPTGDWAFHRAEAYRLGFEAAAAEAGDLVVLFPELDTDAETLDPED